jgi:hypothetical protein
MTPEERLSELVAHRRRELEGHVARVDELVTDIEHREELVRDSRASVERLLRVGTADLEGRETDLVQLQEELEEREARIAREEDELARRRGELGAVELKRAALEQREAALDARESRVIALEERLESPGHVRDVHENEPQDLVAFVPGERYRLMELSLTAPPAGGTIDVEGETYEIARYGPSPLPGDARRCLYLVRGRRSASDGSS